VTLGARACLFGAAVAAACTPNGAPSTLAAEAGGIDASASVPGTAPSAGAAQKEASRWAGTYKSVAASIYVPDAAEWSGFKWRGADAGEGLGEGPISLTVDARTHLVSGAAGGPIGDVILTGTDDDGRLVASVRRKDARDQGLTGTLVAVPSPDHIDGTMRLSYGDAHIVREATFHLTTAAPP
jgi:hypothetical protein